MIELREIFFLPPMAVARLGAGETPLESFEWVQDLDAHGNNKTVIRSNVTLKEQEDGTVFAHKPDPMKIQFRDEDTDALRPVAPFFELWALMHDGVSGETYETPVTLELLDDLGISLKNVSYAVTVGNSKAARRTGDAACSFRARVEVPGDDHERHALKGFSPHTSKQQPLVYADNPIPMGHFRVVRPQYKSVTLEGEEQPIDLSVLRVRFTPPKGEVYGPPDVAYAPATLAVPGYINDPPAAEYGRIHEIVRPENRILNPDTPWSKWVMMSGLSDDPEPHDSYDGARVGNNQAWGIADDTSDGLIEATLTLGGERFKASARVMTGPPDFAPDKRPFYSLSTDLEDRDLPLVEITEANCEAAQNEVMEIFRCAFETNSLVNLDDIRAQGLADNAGLQKKTGVGAFDGMWSTDASSMTAHDAVKPSKITELIQPQPVSIYSKSVPNDRLPYTVATTFVHEQMIDEAIMLDFLKRRGDYVKKVLRPPFGVLSEIEEDPDPDAKPNDNFRDPRVVRDLLHDARMPPYMRDSNYFPLSLSRRQYNLVVGFIDYLNAEPSNTASHPEEGDADVPKS